MDAAGLTYLSVPGDDPGTFPKYFLNLFADYKNEDVPIKPEALPISRPLKLRRTRGTAVSETSTVRLRASDVAKSPTRAGPW